VGRDRRDLGHAAPGGTQATAMMVAELVVEEHEVETESR